VKTDAETDSMKPRLKSSGTLKKRNDNLLYSSEKKYSLIFRHSPNAMCISTIEEGRYVDVNDVYINKLGYKREEIIGRTSTDINLWIDISEREAMVRKLTQTGNVTNYELRFRDKRGAIRWGLTSASQIEIGAQLYLLTQTQDITQYKLAEEKSRRSEENFRKIFMTTPDCIAISRMKDGLLINVNKGFEDVVGWKREKAIGSRVTEPPLNFWVDPSAREFMVAQLKADRDVLHREIEFRRGDGLIRAGVYSARPINIDDEECIIFILQDITERRQAEEKFFKMFMTTPELVGITQLKDGLISDVNKGFEDIVGWKREIAIGKKSTESPINFWVDSSERDFMTTELRAGRDVLHRQIKFRRSDGSVRDGVYSARSINVDSEASLIFIMQDITEIERINVEHQRTLESLRKAVGTTIQVLVSALEAKDPYTAGHQSRSADLARTIATEMGLDQDKIEGIRMAGSIHDIGKLSIPSEILTKPTKLTSLEFSLIKEHPQSGYDMLKHVESP
jgi:PAS domain S-box-containing protein